MMTKPTETYQDSIQVTASKEACFRAIATQMDRWWTQATEGSLSGVGDHVTVRFPPDHGFWGFEATVFEKPHRIEMTCTEAHHRVPGNARDIEQEWLGTKVVWEFSTAGDKTDIKMTHIGLTPKLNCWEICFDGWNYFFKNSLKAFLDGEDGSPHSAA